MKTIRLTDCGGPYRDAMELYKMSFPAHEQREERSQKSIMSDPGYHFELVYDGDTWAAVMLYWETDSFVYLEHFCVFPELRGKEYGRRALELLAQKGKTVILEIDPPVDEISIRRKGFYERAGYTANEFRHVHPPYHKGNAGHELVVMSYPRALSREEYDGFSRYLAGVVMAGAFDE